MPGPLPLGTMARLPDTAPLVYSGVDLRAVRDLCCSPSIQFILKTIQSS